MASVHHQISYIAVTYNMGLLKDFVPWDKFVVGVLKHFASWVIETF